MSTVDPTIESILIVGKSDPRKLEAELDGEYPDVTAATRETADEALSDLRNGQSPDCVVLERESIATDWRDVIDSIVVTGDAPPVVLWIDGPDPEAAGITSDSAVEYCVATPIDEPSYRSIGQAVMNAVIDDAIREHENREATELLDAIFEKLPVFVYFKDDEARYVRAPEDYLGPGESFIGKTDAEVYEDDFGEELYEDDLHVLETGEPIIDKHIEDGVYPLAPSDPHVSTTKVPWRDSDGEIKGIIGVTQNITELKEQERQLERQNERLEEFAGVVAHDLRNPLNVAQGLLELATEADDVETARELQEPLERMEALIEDLLTLARLGQTVSEPQRISVAAIARDSIETVDTKQAEFDVAMDNEEIEADPDRLRQLFENLFRNAIEHGGSDVTVTVGVLEDGFYVADDGPGIPDDERERVFEHGHTTSTDGTGLGLSIVRNVVGAHGWEIAVEESEAGGARFAITGVDRYAGFETTASDGEKSETTIETGASFGSAAGDGALDVRDCGEQFEVTANGLNVWQLENKFHYVYERVEGDVDFRTRVNSLEPAHSFSKAGVMLREELVEYASHMYAGITAGAGAETLFSKYPEDRTLETNAGDGRRVPCWVRMTREGDQFAGYVSDDGESWTEIDRRTIPMDEEFYAGLAVCSVDERELTTARFDSVSGLDEWDNQDIGSVSIGGHTERIPRDEHVLEGAGCGLTAPDPGGYHASATLEGDGLCTARVVSFDSEAPSDAEAGVVVRATGDGNAWAAGASLTPEGEPTFGWTGPDGDHERHANADVFGGAEDVHTRELAIDRALPGSVRIERRNDRVVARYSRHGGDWLELGRTTLPDDSVEIGLAVASGDPGKTTSATFDLVEIDK